ncbi:MAG: PQQ-binding-like beta-propeller repeat protein [Candidatus Aminicenantes bacterium]|nr:PQQ-binding-like beta-propeller repeat protein [Candidatus Aminicenantes bacterium]
MKKRACFISLVIGLMCVSSFGQIESQWRGPLRDGIYPEKDLLKEWPKDGPELLWTAEDLGDGYSSPSVTSGRVYVTGMEGGRGYLFSLALDGRLLWKAAYGPEWNGSSPGARTTPTVVGERIYLMSALGGAVCFDLEGKIIWEVDLRKIFGARNIEWGMTESPLVDGSKVFFTPGGRTALIVALDRITGETVWKTQGHGEKSGYCSPCLVKHGNLKLLLTMTSQSIVGLDAETGELLWTRKHITEYEVNANTPLYHNGYVYTNSGYGTGGQMFKLSEDGKTIENVWTQRSPDSQMGAVILVDGYIYGSGHNQRGWHCVDWNTGKVQYSARSVRSKGSLIFADAMLYYYREIGDLLLVRPNSEEFENLGSIRINKGSGEHWAHPVIKDGRLYVRHGDALMVYNVAKK